MRRIWFVVGARCGSPLPIMITLLILSLTIPPTTSAQEADNHLWQVFLERDIDQTGLDRLIFVDTSTGDEVEIEVDGINYTIFNEEVLFYDIAQGWVMRATPNGRVRRHPFIQPEVDTRRLDWIMTENGNQIAWTLTSLDDQGRLKTVTMVANSDGKDERMVLTDVDDTGGNLRALPLAFSPDGEALYMDVQPDGINDYTPFNLYASLFALDLTTGDSTPLPGEPANCLCGADFQAGLFVRLRLTPDLQGFDVYVYDLASEVEQTITSLPLSNYTLSGDVLISPDGKKAVYTLARVSNFGSAQESIQAIFVLVDLVTMTQERLTNPLPIFVRPVTWTEDNGAIIYTSPTQDGTWKINLDDRRLERIANGIYIGSLH